MSAESLEDLFVEGLKEMYYTEQQLVDALEDLEAGSAEDEIKSAFSEHRSETQQHVERLEDVFETIGHDAEANEDPIVEAMIQQHEEFADPDPDEKILERYNLMAAQKSEHYEIASYGNLIPLAQQLGHGDVADELEEIMREEQDALEEVSELGEAFDYGDIQSPQ